MEKAITEYRINKKGAECFRTRFEGEARKKLEELRAKKPNVAFTLQTRCCYTDRRGIPNTDPSGNWCWTPWS